MADVCFVVFLTYFVPRCVVIGFFALCVPIAISLWWYWLAKRALLGRKKACGDVSITRLNSANDIHILIMIFIVLQSQVVINT